MFTCERCNHSFKAKQGLQRHMNRKRPCTEMPKPIITENSDITVNIKGITLADLKLLLGDKIVVTEVNNNTSVPLTPPQTPLEVTVASLLDRVSKLEEKRTITLPVVEPIDNMVASTSESSDNESSKPEEKRNIIKKKNIKKRNIKKDKQNAKEKVEEIKEVSTDDLVQKANELNESINDKRDVAESIIELKGHETVATKRLLREIHKLNLDLLKVKKELKLQGFDTKKLKLKVRTQDKMHD